jgi:hypothetical protein
MKNEEFASAFPSFASKHSLNLMIIIYFSHGRTQIGVEAFSCLYSGSKFFMLHALFFT